MKINDVVLSNRGSKERDWKDFRMTAAQRIRDFQSRLEFQEKKPPGKNKTKQNKKTHQI